MIARNMACLKDCTGASLVVKRFVQIADLCGAYEMCLSVDLRDVLFQADPFPMVLPPNPVHDLVLHCEDDRVPLGASHFNRIWMGLCYGGRFMNEVRQKVRHQLGRRLRDVARVQLLGRAAAHELHAS